MSLVELLTDSGGVQSLARELGLTESQAALGASALLPAILGGFKKQAQAGGLGGLGGLLGKLGGGSLLDEVLSRKPTDIGRGNEVLGAIFGSKDVSRAVAESASARSRLDPSVLKKMLPLLAMIVSGYMAKESAPPQTAHIGGFLGELLGGGAPPKAGGGLAGLASMLDMDRDGNPLDDIMGMVRDGQR
ncbi:MAG: DUF937 domain-containing protein [Gemmatimonadaceae bacterium]|nr:DUF937 domain-containing protein [Gemmatimonadaceae bacterium]